MERVNDSREMKMGRFTGNAKDYDPAWEETAGNQIRRLREITGRNEFEIWCGDEGFLVAEPQRCIYRSYIGDDSELVGETGKTYSEFMQCILPRCGCAYSLTPEHYEKKTGQPFPEGAGEPAMSIINFSTNWFHQYY